MLDELQKTGPDRYEITMTTPWGQAVPAELILATRKGWSQRPESRDSHWAAFLVGPVVVAIRLQSSLSPASAAPEPTPEPEPAMAWPVPAEWN